MKLEQAEKALTLYEENEIGLDADETFTCDLITDLLHLVREQGGNIDRCLDVIVHNLETEPESASDYRQFAEYHEQQGHTSQAAKLYEQADEADDLARGK